MHVHRLVSRPGGADGHSADRNVRFPTSACLP